MLLQMQRLFEPRLEGDVWLGGNERVERRMDLGIYAFEYTLEAVLALTLLLDGPSASEAAHRLSGRTRERGKGAPW